MTRADAPPEIPAVLFFAYGMYAAVDWLYSKVPVRFPDIKICLSEGGIGWVAGLIDRLDHCFKYQLGYLPTWRDVDLTPSEVLRRNFWFCALDDTSGFAIRDASASTTSSSSPTTRTPTPRGPTRRRCSCEQLEGQASTNTRSAASAGRTRSSCSATRSRPNCSADTRAARFSASAARPERRPRCAMPDCGRG